MRKTLLAVGFAVLVSMLLAPHGGKSGVKGWGLFFSDYGLYMRTEWGDLRTAQFGYGGIGKVMIDMLALEIVFLAVLFAVIVNIRWRRKKETEKS
jgi:hypothetical protein